MKINTSNSKVNFSIKKMFFLKVQGTLPVVNGEVELDENNLSNAKIDLSIPLAGIDTKNNQRNKHLLQADFFNAENFPAIDFKSSEINKKDGVYIAKGTLNMAGTAKTIEIPFKFSNNTATGNFSIDRTDYNVGKLPAFIVAKEVQISFNCSL